MAAATHPWAKRTCRQTGPTVSRKHWQNTECGACAAIWSPTIYFSGPLIGDSWEALDLQEDYSAQAGALGAQDGVAHAHVARNGARCCVVTIDPLQSGLRVINLTGNAAPLSLYRSPGSDVLYASGSLPANQPQHDYTLSAPDGALFAANLLRDALTRRGIALSGNVR